MSLLMDALKKAERAKTGESEWHAGTGASPGAVRDLAAELGLEARAAAPRPSPAATATSKAETQDFASSLTLEPLASPAQSGQAAAGDHPANPAPSAAPVSPAANPRPTGAPRADRQGPPSTPGPDRLTARAVFASKQARDRTISPFHATLAVLFLAFVATAAYFWWQLRPASAPPAKPLAAGPIASPASASEPGRTAPPTPPTTVQPVEPPAIPAFSAPAQPAAVAPIAAVPAMSAGAASTPAISAVQAAPAIPFRAATPATAEPGASAPRPATAAVKGPAPVGPRSAAPSASAQGGAPVETPTGLRITRDQAQASVDPAVNAGYAALIEGNDAAARDHYGRALANDRTNRDALYGMATLAARAGRPEEAQSYYRRVLDLNPRDAFAQAQLSALAGGSQAVDESRVRGLVAQQTDAAAGAPLSFTLGNRLAAQGRWAEAQQAYFSAFAAEPDNPDYCYNLAVALDQLHQTRPAKTYYERALDLAQKRRAGFDVERVRTRLAAIAAQP